MEPFPSRSTTVTLPIDLFKCPVCLDLPPVDKRKVYQCKNGHLRCEQCDEKLRLSKPLTCPTCRCSLSDHERSRNMVAEEVLEYIESPCPFESDGCSVILPRRLLIKHLEECLFRSVRLCALLGLNDCSFDSFNPDGLIGHLKMAHQIPHNTNEFTSYDYDFAMNDISPFEETTSAPQIIKTVMSPHFRLLPIESRPFFIHVLKEDTNSDGFYFLCLFVGKNEKDAERFFATYYFSGTDTRKSVVSWPMVWYKHAIRNNDAGNVNGCEVGFRLSKNLLQRIQGKAKTANIFIRIREREDHSKWLSHDDSRSRWQSNGDELPSP